MNKPIPLPIKILGVPVLAFLAVFGTWYFGLWDWPALSVAVVLAAVLGGLSIVWPEGFRRRR